MFCSQKIPDLIGSIETYRFEYLYRKDLRSLQPRHTGHQLRDALRHRIGFIRTTRGIYGDEDPCRQARFVEGRGAFEDEIVRIEVLHENDVARSNLLRTYEALSYP